MEAGVLSTRNRGQKVSHLGTTQGPSWFQIQHSWPCQLVIGVMWKLLQWLELLMGVTQMPSRADGLQCVMQGLYRIGKAWELLFRHSVVSDSLQPHGLQHARLFFPSPSPGACSDSSPLSWWCRPTISLSVVPVSSCLQSFPASAFFLMSQVFASGSQNIGASASASVLPMNTQDWFPLGSTGLISLQSKWLSRVLFKTTVQKYQFFSAQHSL